jgi:hypothetical protein
MFLYKVHKSFGRCDAYISLTAYAEILCLETRPEHSSCSNTKYINISEDVISYSSLSVYEEILCLQTRPDVHLVLKEYLNISEDVISYSSLSAYEEIVCLQTRPDVHLVLKST